MMRRPYARFFFSVEGETEKWYLEKLQELINRNEMRSHNAVFKIKRCRPVSFAKGLAVLDDVKINHFFDYESVEEENGFRQILGDMDKAENLGKSVKYFPCYSNLSFELWIVLHKTDCRKNLADKKDYLPLINKVFGVKYQGIKEYKEEANFKNLLNSITLEDVKSAVSRAEKIMKDNNENKKAVQFRHRKYYQDNPATEVGTAVADILWRCGLYP